MQFSQLHECESEIVRQIYSPYPFYVSVVGILDLLLELLLLYYFPNCDMEGRNSKCYRLQNVKVKREVATYRRIDRAAGKQLILQ